MTREEFIKIAGREPEVDDLDRANCDAAGEVGHWSCGICPCGKPRFLCGDHAFHRRGDPEGVDAFEAWRRLPPRKYTVVIVYKAQRTYEVQARTEEEAESQAWDLYEKGIAGVSPGDYREIQNIVAEEVRDE